MATLIPSFKKDNPFESINDNELIGLTFNDQDGPSNNILWSSSKIVNLIPKGQFQAKQPNAVLEILQNLEMKIILDKQLTLEFY